MSDSSIGQIQHQRMKALRSVLLAKPSLLTDVALFDFLSTYFLCEALANRLIEYWEADLPPKSVKPPHAVTCSTCGAEIKCSTSKKRRSGSGFNALDVGNLKKALRHFAINCSIESTEAIFRSGNGIVGQRTVRQLRNGYAHSLSIGAKDEIVSRSGELIYLMGGFCNAVEERLSQPDDAYDILE